MNGNVPETLRDYLKSRDEELADRANHFWRISKQILDRQSRPNSNENGEVHVKMVERNIWRLIKDSGNVSEFTPYEVFLLSCSACCHDFDKGLFDSLPYDMEHGEGSGDYVFKEFKTFLQNFHESFAIKKIIGIHDFSSERFHEELKKVDLSFSLSSGPVKLQKLAVIFKAADILHTDNSRIPTMGVDLAKLTDKQKNKHHARESISG
ncbi:MAG: hypothetical protein KKD44_17845 [Proteobacteria bacterium]|nr:hypothetical protein [Pseudomonadota bacterium]